MCCAFPAPGALYKKHQLKVERRMKLDGREVKGEHILQWKMAHFDLAVDMMKLRYSILKESDK